MPLKAKVKATLSTRYSLSTSTLCQLCSRYVARPTCHHELTAAAKTAARSKKRRKKRRNRSTILSRPKALRGKKRRRDSPSRPSSPATLAASASEPESQPGSTTQVAQQSSDSPKMLPCHSLHDSGDHYWCDFWCGLDSSLW